MQATPRPSAPKQKLSSAFAAWASVLSCAATKMLRSRQLFPLLFAALCSGLSAQEPDPCLQRTVPATVTDWRGNVLTDLKRENFHAQAGGKPVKVLSASPSEGKGRLLILLDTSGSMLEPEASWKTALAVTRLVVGSLPPGTGLALGHHTNRIEGIVGFDQSRAAILTMLEHLQSANKTLPRKPIRRTALADVLVEAIGLFGTPRPGDTILAVTDGDSRGDVISDRNVRDALIRAGLRLFVVFQRSLYWVVESRFANARQVRDTPSEKDGVIRFTDLASFSGGNTVSFFPNLLGKYELNEINAFVPGGDSRVSPKISLERLGQEIASFYQLELELPSALAKPAKLRIEVAEVPGKKKKDLFVHFPKQLAACSQGN